MNHYTLECCVDSVESAVQAKKGGADRLELCSNLVIGGTTPTLALFRQIRKTVNIRIHALIRPRFGDFLYSRQELSVIEKEIDMFREAGAEGVVIGCLRPDGSLALEEMKQLMKHAGDMHVTLHRAFDMTSDPLKALEEAVELGIHTILTSGQRATCLEGIDTINELCRRAGNRITILAGAGINASAVEILLKQTPVRAFHMSGKRVLNSAMTYRNPYVSMGIPGMSEYEIWQTDPDEIASVKRLIH